MPGELIVRVSDRTTLRAFEREMAQHGVRVIRRVDRLNLVRVTLPDGMDVSEGERLFKDIDRVQRTHRNVRTEVPKDVGELPLLEDGQQLQPVIQSGNELIGNTDPSSKAGYGGGVTVAVLDTGVDERHPAIVDRCVGGYNFVAETTDTIDRNGHGTACAAIIAGSGYGPDSVDGVAPRSDIVPVKVMDNRGRGESFAVIEGLMYALDRGANVINLSIGTLGSSAVLRETIEYILDQGVHVVAAAGNTGNRDILQPAGYPGVICVGAVDAGGRHAPFSNYGDEVDVVAPGVGVHTAGLKDSRILFSGTSAAAPFVAGVLAAVSSEYPHLTPAQVRERVLKNADNLGPGGRDPLYGEGMVNLKRAVRPSYSDEVDAALTTVYFDPAELRPGLNTTIRYVVQNQGAQRLRACRAITRLLGEEQRDTLPDLDPGECFEITRKWRVPDEVPEGSLRIEGYVDPGASDSEPDDNGRAVLLRRSQWM
jgi:subtilisin family serine protease